MKVLALRWAMKIALVLLTLQVSSVSADGMESEQKFIELSTDTWVLSLPDSWKPKAVEGGIRVDSKDELFSIYVATYRVDTSLSGWAKRDIEIVKGAKYSSPENDFKFMLEEIELDSEIQYFVLDAYDEKSSFRIYTKHYRIGNKLVTFSIHDYWCESYKESAAFTDELLQGFKIKS